jgi:hypothetical protein
MRKTLAALLLLMLAGITAASQVDRPRHEVPDNFKVQEKIEVAFPLLYGGSKVKQWVVLDLQQHNKPFAKPPFGKIIQCSWSVKGVCVDDNDLNCHFRGWIAYRPEMPEEKRWALRLRDDIFEAERYR